MSAKIKVKLPKKSGDNICQECFRYLPPPAREQRGDHHSELVTYCPCGATYTGGI